MPTSTFNSWYGRGLTLAQLRRVEVQSTERSSAWHWLVLQALLLSVAIGMGRFAVEGDAEFSAWAVAPWALGWAVSALLLWLGFEHSHHTHSAAQVPSSQVGCALVLLTAACLPVELFSSLAAIASAHAKEWLSATAVAWLQFAMFWLVQLWWLIIWLKVAHAFNMRVRPALATALVGSAMGLALAHYWPAQFWYPVEQKQEAAVRMQLTQELFESQNLLLASQLQAIAPQREDQRDVFVLTYAPYAAEDVFKKESEMVRTVLGARFDAANRSLSLLNNPRTTATHAWATPANLQKALDALAQKMDKEQDLLMLYLTSHGAKDFKLASSHWPLTVPTLTPQELAAMLDKSGIKHRVIAVSACYSGGWIEPLKTEHSLVMTAADATHTSYGCGLRSELTFFGRAVFDEQLRQETKSFEQAFTAALPIIKKREDVAGKDDGFSNPQIFVGASIRPVLAELEKAP